MNQLIYVETSIPSFYYETRPAPQMQVRRDWTREWWEKAKWQDALVTSPVVIAEMEETPDAEKREQMLALVSGLPRLDYTEAIDSVVAVYFAHKLMPLDSGGDAHHLALASWHRCDILVTWNCKHLANGNKTGHIHLINNTLGLHTPQIITPLELLESEL